MPINVMDVINPESVQQYIEGVPQQNVIGEVLFPRKKQVGIDLTFIKGAKNKPVALRPSAFDVNVRIRALRASLDQKTKELPFFKESVVIKERDRQNLLLAMQAQNAQMRDLILSQIYEDISGLVDGGDIQAERMRMQLISEGKIYMATTNDVEINFDYEMPADHKEALSGTAMWSDFENADIVGDIERWKTKVEDDTGSKITRIVLTVATFNLIKKNKAIKFDISKDGTTIITDSVIINYINEKLGLKVAILSGKYIAEDGTQQPYYPDYKVTLLPDGALGNTYYGTTPEEADLMAGNTTNVKVVRTGIAITIIKKEDPVTVQTKVSQLCLPSFEHVEEIFIATVA